MTGPKALSHDATPDKLPSRRIGSLAVGAQCLGCLGMSEFYGPAAARRR